MYRLIYQDGDTPQAYTFTEGEVTIGRSPECQIVLKDFGISRTHARLIADDDGVRIQDLKSKNGTQVNGVPIVEAPLKDGDRILLGKFQIAFSKTLEGKVVLDEAKPLSEEAGTIIRSVGELSKLLSDTGQREVAGPAAEKKQAPDAHVQDVEKANRILKVLTKVAETLIAVRPVEEVLQQVMDIVFEHIPADRGFLMLSEDDGPDKLIPMVVKHRNSNSATDGQDHHLQDDRRPRHQGPRVDPDLRRDGRPALRGRRLHPLPRHPQRDVRAAVEQGPRHRDHPRGLADADELLHPERPRPPDRARQLRGGGGRARAAQPEDRGRGEEARAPGPLPVAAGHEPHPRHLGVAGLGPRACRRSRT